MRYTENDRGFFSQPAEKLGPQLLGKTLCRRLLDGQVLRLKIVDVEAYGANDTANYGFGYEGNGGSKRKTKTNAPLFEQGGISCIYANMLLIVCGEKGQPDNILIRGGADQNNRYDGPIKVARALQIDSDAAFKKVDLLTSDALWIEDDDRMGPVCRTVRHGLGNSVNKEDKEIRARFITI